MAQIGAYVKATRIELSKSQVQLAKEAGISRSTLSPLENGDSVTLETLIRVLRVLGSLDVMEYFVVLETVSPMQLRNLMQKQKKQRVRTKKASQA